MTRHTANKDTDEMASHENHQLTNIGGIGDVSDQPGMKSTMTKNQIFKNLIVISISYLFLFTAFQSLQNLQSSLNKEEGLGTAGLSVIYGSGVIAGLLLPAFLISRIGCKWSIAASMVCYIAYMAANMYPMWGTIIPASVIIGTGAAPLWAAKCTYLTQIGVWYSRITGATKDATVNLFFGIFFMTFQTSQIWGNMLSSLLFKRPAVNMTNEDVRECGALYCPTSYINNTNLDRPSLPKIYTLCGIYLGCGCLAVVMVVAFLDKISLDSADCNTAKSGRTGQNQSLNLLTSIVKHLWKSKYLKLLAPLTIYSGIEQAFVAGEFTRSYISCSIGIWNVGFVMIAYGAVDASCSFIFGRLVKFVGHIPFFSLAFLVHGGSQIALLLWMPSSDNKHLLYLFASLWGAGDAIIQTQINAFYGYLFSDKPETAFAIYRIFESAGFIIAFSYSNYLCTSVKIYITLCFLVVGMTLYGAVELLDRRKVEDEIQERYPEL